MFWSFRVGFFYSVVTFVLLALTCISVPMHLFNVNYSFRYKWAEVFSCAFIFLLKYICNIDCAIHGLEILPEEGPYLILPNHQSFWENIFMQVIIPKHSWVIKRELYNIPIFGLALKFVQPIAVDRSAYISVRQIIEEGMKRLKNGIPIVLFPEGKRVEYMERVQFKPSAAQLALKANVPIVLIVHNAGKVWPKSGIKKGGGLINLKLIELISKDRLAEFNTRSLTNYIEERINTEKDKL